MKAILTLTFVLFFGAIAMAQDTTDKKAETIEMGVVLLEDTLDSKVEFITNETKTIARIYKSKNSRVKKELIFTTKYSKAKLA